MLDPRPSFHAAGLDIGAVLQMTVVARDCDGPLTDIGVLTAACLRAAEESGLQVVGEATHAFVPHGASVVILLAQSHLVLSTWPEHQLAIADISMCGTESAAGQARSVLMQVLSC